MKKITALLLILALAMSLALAACTGDEGNDNDNKNDTNTEVFEGTLDEINASIIENSGVQGVGTFEDIITDENCEFTIGLSADDLNNYMETGLLSMAAINAQAHLAALIKAKDASSATKLAELIAEKFNVHRWICVVPEKCYVITAGSYVYFVASNNETAEGYINSFKALAGNAAGEANLFYDISNDANEGGGQGGGISIGGLDLGGVDLGGGLDFTPDEDMENVDGEEANG